MRIGNFELEETILIVAEIGNNHEGRFDVARELVHRAAESNAGAVKFQTFRAREFINPSDKARLERMSSFELSEDQFRELEQLSRAVGLLFLSTPLDLPSARFLGELVDAYKIASGDNDFLPLIEEVCAVGKPILLSTGVSDLARVRASKAFIQNQWASRGITQELAVLHCVSSYPVPAEQANLWSIAYLADRVGGPIGYSDHTLGIDACLFAVAAGARIIEKHFTLDKHFSDFRDHQLSADPPEMKRLVEEVARIQAFLGKAEKVIQPCEAEMTSLIRRSIVAAIDLPQGHCLSKEDLTWMRPAGGLSPGQEHQVLDRKLRRPLQRGEQVLPNDVE